MKILSKYVGSQLAFLLWLTAFMLSCTAQEPDYTKTPVFFVHGHNCRDRNWDKIISLLVKSGYPRQYLRAIKLIPNDGANIEAAENQIAPAIEEFLKTINNYLQQEHLAIPLKMKVDIVSHSMGALSARWYAAKVRPDRVRVWLSLVGVNHGTNALCGASGEGGAEMCPAYAKSEKESFIQYALNGAAGTDIDETPYGIGKDSAGVASLTPDENRRILYVTLRVASDIFIKPGDSAMLDGAGGTDIPIPEKLQASQTSSGNILVTVPLDHDQLLKNKVLIELIKNVLGTTF